MLTWPTFAYAALILPKFNILLFFKPGIISVKTSAASTAG